MEGTSGDTAVKVLFIGNSFTARNNLPGLIGQLAAARGKTMDSRLISAGGASLRRHWNGGEAAKAIKDGHYNHVVLQEQSTLPIKNAKRMHENIRLFDAAIKDEGAKTVLYMTWARERRLFGRAERNLPSRFVDELPVELTERQGSAGAAASRNGTWAPSPPSTCRAISLTAASRWASARNIRGCRAAPPRLR